METKYMVVEYSRFMQNGEVKESTAIYKYSEYLEALRAYHQKLAGACSNTDWLEEMCTLMNTAGQSMFSEYIPCETYRANAPAQEE